MQCRDCGYDLWNLTEPRCPECGLQFDLRSYRFVPDTVAFACPDCGSLHGGSGDSYLPATSDTATCQACGRPMQVPRMRVVPLVDDPPSAVAFTLPWDNRAQLGWWQAWWQTTKLAMGRPSEVVRQSSPGSTWGSSYRYALTTYLVGLGINAVLFGVLFGVGMLFAGSASAGLEVAALIALIVVGVLIYAGLLPLIILVFTAIPAHLFLWLFASERKGGFTTTARFINYAQAPMILLGIPLCGLHIGGNVGWIWVVVASILMLRAAHGVSGFKASMAVLWLPITLFVLYIASFVALFMASPAP